MTKVSLHGLDVITRADRSNGVAMSKIVEAGIRASECGYCLLVALDDSPIGKMLTNLVCKNETAILPKAAGFQTLLRLNRLVMTEQIHNPCCNNDRPLSTVLGRNNVILTLTALDLLELLINKNLAAIKIHTIPFQTEHFSNTHSGEECNNEKNLKLTASDFFEKCAGFFFVKRFELVLFGSRKDTCLRRIVADIAISLSLLQSTVQNAVNVFDRLC